MPDRKENSIFPQHDHSGKRQWQQTSWKDMERGESKKGDRWKWEL